MTLQVQLPKCLSPGSSWETFSGVGFIPSSGTAREVGGMISASRRKKTVRERRIDMHKVTCKEQ